MKYRLLIVLSCLHIMVYAQNFRVSQDDPTLITEYNDGKLWAYRHINNCVVGLTCYEAKDNYGKYYQIMMFIKNLNASNVTFEPDEVTSYLINGNNDIISLQVYTNEEFQKKVKRSQDLAMALYGFSVGFNAGYSSSYSHGTNTYYNYNAASQANVVANMQIIALGKSMEDERTIKEQGYLKRTTIHSNEGIIGYMNIKRKKGNILIVNVPIDECTYSFEWDVSKKKKK